MSPAWWPVAAGVAVVVAVVQAGSGLVLGLLLPSVLFGASGAGAHEPTEWADLASVGRLARVLVEAARRFWG